MISAEVSRVKASISVTVGIEPGAGDILRRLADTVDGVVSVDTAKTEDEPKRKRRTKAEMEASKESNDEDEEVDEISPRKSKSKSVDEDADDEEQEDETDDSEEDDEEETEDEEEETPKKKADAKKVTGLSLDGDIRPAFQRYAKKYSREKAMEVLKKYKVASVNDLPAAKYKEVLGLLN